jgi:hypothetical protein
MRKLNRSNFLKISTAAILLPIYNKLAAQADTGVGFSNFEDEELMLQLNQANNLQVELLLESIRPGNLKFGRKIAYDFSILTAGFCSAKSKYHHNEQLIPKLDLLVKFLLQAQTTDGTVNIGNLESPPDTAFLVEILGAAASILAEDNSTATTSLQLQLKEMLQKAGNALVTGGVHTPNHRWVICAALAQLHSLYPDKRYTTRIDDWMGEGIFNDKDGNYPERSGTYSMVENTALISISRFLKKPSLLEPVRKNLQLFYYHIEPDGELVSIDSRRQDQYVPRNSNILYLQYRYLAILDNNKLFAAITKDIEGKKDYQEIILNRSLFYFLENKLLQKQLPLGSSLPDYEKFIPSSQLLRIKRNDTTASLFGGIDWPLIIASGRSCSPDFFTYRKGKAILKYLRLSSSFFSMGYFYSDGVKKSGNSYVLHKKLSVPYYQPLPKDKRNKNGDYKLSPSIDDRFWNKMDFKNRPVSNLKTLETTITFTEEKGNAELVINISGLKDVQVTIELCFSENGTLSGNMETIEGNSFLKDGFGSFESGGDKIQFGPGKAEHRSVEGLEGERYSTHFGTLRTKGQHVCITGITPFFHTLKFA